MGMEMKLWSLTREKIDKLLKEEKKKSKQGKGGGRSGKADNSKPSAQGMKIEATISDSMHKKAAQATAAKERKASKAKNLNTSGDVAMDGLNNTNNSNDSFDAFESSMQMDSAFQPKRSFSQISNSFSSQWQVDGMPAKPEKSKKPKGSYFNKFSDSDSDNDVEPLSIPDQPRDQPPRRGTQQKKLPKYTEDSDDDDLEEIS